MNMQCDILLNALVSIKAQNGKWDAKVQLYGPCSICHTIYYFRNKLRLFIISKDKRIFFIILGQRSRSNNHKYEPNIETKERRTSKVGDELRKIQGTN